MKWVLCFGRDFDEWVKPKVENGYHRFFELCRKDIVNLVQATRNHPLL
jgi:beta-galactosidase